MRIRAIAGVGLGLLALGTTGCLGLLGAEGAAVPELYDGAPLAPRVIAVAPRVAAGAPEVVTLREGQAILVLASPGSEVTCVASPAPARRSRFRASPYGEDEAEARVRPPYKPSPCDEARPHGLYRED
jgi:hypothetical protein